MLCFNCQRGKLDEMTLQDLGFYFFINRFSLLLAWTASSILLAGPLVELTSGEGYAVLLDFGREVELLVGSSALEVELWLQKEHRELQEWEQTG